jgi:GNAT superfamily N-acetyltransferase
VSYSISLARPRDLTKLAAIEQRAGALLEGVAPRSILAEYTPDEDFRAAQADGRLWVALHDDEPVGFAIVELLDDGLPHLEEIDVDPDHGRRGLGAALVREVCAWTAARGFAEITLTTFRAVPWNQPFYARMGFELVPEPSLRPALRDVIRYEAARGLDPGGRDRCRRPGGSRIYICGRRRRPSGRVPSQLLSNRRNEHAFPSRHGCDRQPRLPLGQGGRRRRAPDRRRAPGWGRGSDRPHPAALW